MSIFGPVETDNQRLYIRIVPDLADPLSSLPQDQSDFIIILQSQAQGWTDAGGRSGSALSNYEAYLDVNCLPTDLLTGPNKCQADFGDVWFYAEETLQTRLPVAIIRASYTDPDLRVLVPYVSNTKDTKIWVVWNATPTQTPQGDTDTYGAFAACHPDCLVAWKMDDDPTVGLKDWANGLSATAADGGMTVAENVVPSQRTLYDSNENVWYFDYGDDVDYGDVTLFDGKTALTYIGWTEPEFVDGDTRQYIATKNNALSFWRKTDWESFRASFYDGANFIGLQSGVNDYLANTHIYPSAWFHWAASWEAPPSYATNLRRFGTDGNVDKTEWGSSGTGEPTEINNSTNVFALGSDGTTNYFEGQMGETRFYAANLVGDWSDLVYKNQWNAGGTIMPSDSTFQPVYDIGSIQAWWDVNGPCTLRDDGITTGNGTYDRLFEVRFQRMTDAPEPVGQWRVIIMDDRTGNANHLVQWTPEKQPVYDHVRKVIVGDGYTTPRNMKVTPGASFFSTSMSVAANVGSHFSAPSLTRVPWDIGRDGSTGFRRETNTSHTGHDIDVGGGTLTASTEPVAGDRWNEVFTTSGSAQTWYINGSSVATGTETFVKPTTQNVTILARDDGVISTGWFGDFGALGVFNSVLTSAERTAVDTYMTNQLPAVITGTKVPQFDGTDDDITTSLLLPKSRTRTVAFWMMRATATDEIVIFEQGDVTDTSSYSIGCSLRTSAIRFSYGDSALTNTAQTVHLTFAELPADEWHHVTFVCNGDSKEIFLDGSSVRSISHDHDTLATTVANSMTFGAANVAAWNNFDGRLYDWKCWDRALSDGEVQQNYENSGPPIITPYCAKFDGSNDIVTTGYLMPKRDRRTISFWMIKGTTNTEGCIYGQGAFSTGAAPTDYNCSCILDSGKLWFPYGDSNVGDVAETVWLDYSTEIPADVWTHIVFVVDPNGDNKRVYVNDSLIRSVSYDHNTTTPALGQGLQFGQAPTVATHAFDGSLRDWRMYDRALGDEDVGRLYQGGSFDPMSFSLQYLFGEGSGTNIAETHAGQDGTAANITESTFWVRSVGGEGYVMNEGTGTAIAATVDSANDGTVNNSGASFWGAYE